MPTSDNKENDMLEKQVVEEFLAFPLEGTDTVFEKFAALPGAIYRCGEKPKEQFLYVPGTRSDRALLAAHADTVWDAAYEETRGRGLGADDRAGCAMLWLLKDSGHSLLILDGEEHGAQGSEFLKREYPALFAEMNAHSFIIQLDRRGSSDYKFYKLPVSPEFRTYIELETGYHDAGTESRTDIVVLCETVCGVNLSVGYYDEHGPNESFVYEEWAHTLEVVRNMLIKPLKRYPLV